MKKDVLRYACLCALAMCLPVASPGQETAGEMNVASFAKPPLGWGTWNSFGNSFDSATIQQQASAMVANGMHAAGYQVVLIDEGWWLGARDAAGNIVVDKKQWPAIEPGERPGDMTNIVRYLHKLGLKAGIYTDAGADGCSTWWPDTGPKYPHTGSLGHYPEDFLQFARWGFDYVKVDWCGGDKPNLDPAIQYAQIGQAIADAERETGHQIFYSICDWGKQKPWTWAPGIGGVVQDMWRTGGDIVAPIVNDGSAEHKKRLVTVKNMYVNFDEGLHPEAQHTGYFNDLDMLVLGMRGTNEQLDQLHMALWSISGAPLIVGADLTRLTPAQLATLTNPEVLAINQDALGLQGYRLPSSQPGLEVYVKPLATAGSRAVLLLNRTKVPASIGFNVAELGFLPGASISVRDVWAGREISSSSGQITAVVKPDMGVLLKVSGANVPAQVYLPQQKSANEMPSSCTFCSQQTMKRNYAVFQNVQGDGKFVPAWISFGELEEHPDAVEMQVNGGSTLSVQVPARSAGSSRVAVLLNLPKDRSNEVRFWRADGQPAEVKELELMRPSQQ